MKILITELIWEEGIRELKEEGHTLYYDEHLWRDRDALVTAIPEYDALIVRNQTKVDKELLEAAPDLKVIGRLGVGLDNIDIEFAKVRNIPVVFAKNANATSVAEYVFSAMLASRRFLYLAHEDIKNGGWNRKQFTGNELFNKTLGLIGLGEISHRVAKRAIAFGMKVVGYDPFVTEFDHVVSETGVTNYSTVGEVIKEADFISLHVPLTPATHHLIGLPELTQMKQSVCIINSSRGGIIDEIALANALSANSNMSAVLDVLEEEPISLSHPLLQQNNIMLTPHVAGLTDESQVRTSYLVAKEINKILKGKSSLCTV
ncbi:hydroxyacid dehydrogenase [Rossellomorea marisflavi]|uniref:hydroxyacid dehydrogenase n=1 Tax=Rossellomorea marisflavi TaxID=189381 RepID=UPI00064F4151|nr:hydroxyacid dehydrogenase [Rossellomorea marisflavi]KML25405.1 2-hydroxyacid dehydrogenase [Rossellomorea marisflavi]